MTTERIRTLLTSLPQVSSWPEMRRLIGRPTSSNSKLPWEYAVQACQATGGSEEQALPGAAAVFCLMLSMHLVDDLLDQDPRGLQHELGEGTTANLGLAFQAASSLAIARADISPDRSEALHLCLAKVALDTAYGQNLDLADIGTEEDYWRVVEAKTPPLFSGALFIGGLLGSATIAVAEELKKFGFLLGKLIQISDDLKDALEQPARPDWHRRWNNLPILYALTADHPDRLRFTDLLPEVSDPEILVEAQEILVRSGAVSFCAYNMIDLHRTARQHLASIPLLDHNPLEEILEHHEKPLKSLFRSIGIESPEELLS